MTTTITNTVSLSPTVRERVAVAAGAGVGGLVLLSFTRAVASGSPLLAERHDMWLAIHLASVIPAIPLGGYILLNRKGDGRHRVLGRIWGVMMLAAALSSFALHGLTGRLSWIHILSIVVVIMIPRAVIQAMKHDIRGHRRTMTLTYLGFVVAGLFTFLPGRLLGSWLVG